MTQEIEESVWKEFEEELKKAKSTPVVNLNAGKSESLKKFWDKFLTETLPTGKINQIIEKNFAIFLVQNDCNIEFVKETYKARNFKADGLCGWVKKVQNGDLTTFNIKELLMWANQYSSEDVILLEKAKAELEASAEELPIIPIDELDNLPEEKVSWLCDKIIRTKSLSAITGKRSTLKTWLALSLAVSISSNLPFLEQFNVEPSNVLFIDGESNQQELRKRKNLIKKFHGLKSLRNLFVMSEHYFKLDSEKNLALLEKKITSLNIRLVICDSYRRFISFKEDLADDTSAFFVDKIKPLVNKTGVSFLFLHHERKGNNRNSENEDDMDSVRGSSDFVNMMETILQTKRKGDILTLKQTKNRFYTELKDFNIKKETDVKTYFGFRYLGLDESIEVVCAKTLLKWAKNRKPFSHTQAINFLMSKNFKESTSKKAKNLLEEKGYIQKGEGKRGNFKIIKAEWEDDCG